MWIGARMALALVCLVVRPAVARQQGADSSGAAAKSSSGKVPSKPPGTTTHKSTTHKSSTGKSQTGAHKGTAASSKGTAKSTASGHSTSAKGKHATAHGRKATRTKGQQKIDSERAQTIQEALIREHYLMGEPAGKWNQASEDAMRRYQADHGWQTKTVPDARALISLGLGPSKDHLLNPESAMTTGPSVSRAALKDSAAHGTDAPAASKDQTDPAVASPNHPDSSGPQ